MLPPTGKSPLKVSHHLLRLIDLQAQVFCQRFGTSAINYAVAYLEKTISVGQPRVSYTQ